MSIGAKVLIFALLHISSNEGIFGTDQPRNAFPSQERHQMSLEQIYYSGGRIDLSRLAAGWKALVYLPGSTLAEAHIPHSMNPVERDLVLQEAESMIDAFVKKGSWK